MLSITLQSGPQLYSALLSLRMRDVENNAKNMLKKEKVECNTNTNVMNKYKPAILVVSFEFEFDFDFKFELKIKLWNQFPGT